MAQLSCGEGGSTGAEVVTQINNNTALLDTLSVFEYDSTVDILDIPETYTNVATLIYVDMPAGVYMIGLSATYNLDITQKSVFARFSINGGIPEDFSKEPKDSTDREAFSYSFPYVHSTSGNFELLMDMRKEDTSGVLNTLFANVWVDKKKEV